MSRALLARPSPEPYLTLHAPERQGSGAVPEEMMAVVVEGGKGPPGALKPAQMPRPEPGPGQILIRVRAAGVNRPDLLQRRGAYPPPPGAPETLGLEVSGEVAALGEGAPRWKQGDRVTALLGGGGYAEYATVDARHALPVPPGLDFIGAASLPETVFTVWANVFDIGHLASGESLLLHGANSGIGVTAIQMAKAAGARVFATVRGAHRLGEVAGLGADLVIDTGAEDFAEAVRARGGADVVLDMVGGAYAPKNLACLNPGGRLVQIATLGGNVAEVDMGLVMRKRLSLTGSTLRPRSADEKARLARAVEETVWPWIAAGRLRPVIDRVFPLAEAAAAHAWLEEGGRLGKVMLEA
jgi:putative PIG3 family NAD(P)H quinone oxidoreductase